MKPRNILPSDQIEECINRSLVWVIRSIQANSGKGSSASYHVLKGWSEPYPETTGYLIDTLFDCTYINKELPLKDIAKICADWLCSLQLSDGSFPGGVGGKLQPIVFDTGMIVFGLTRIWEETHEKKYLEALTRSVQWLASCLDEDGVWRKNAFVPGYSPSYHTMVIWAMASANKHLNNKDLHQKLEVAFHKITEKITPQLTIRDWGFRPGEPAFTHTIAYTLQGMFEAGLLLKNKEAPGQVKAIAEEIMQIRQRKGKLAGSFDNHWKADYSFGCLTGQAQLCVLYCRLSQVFQAPAFLQEAQILFEQLIKFQGTIDLEGWYGGIPGSAPIWGKYQRFRFINWGAKYFLDACLSLRRQPRYFGL